MPTRPVDPHHETTRNTLRGLGAVLLTAGALTSVLGLARFVSLFGNDPFASNAPNPAVSVLMFGGGAMIAMLGFNLLFFGFAGRIMRYGMAETLPTTLDAARASAPVAREMAREIADGVRDGFNGETSWRPLPLRHHCGTDNDPDARFCQGCGAELTPMPTQCPKCRSAIELGHAFCHACGAPTSTDREI